MSPPETTNTAHGITAHTVELDGLRLAYRTAGQGEPVLLLHGWPTSSFLWREVMVPMAETNQVVALDLPGFGDSDKPLDASYSFRYHARVLDAFCARLSLERVGLVVHDLGGPVGLYWACQDWQRISRLALLNTLVYPDISWSVKAFALACRVPGVRHFLTSERGLRMAMGLGVSDRALLTDEVIEGVVRPYRTPAARKALLRAGLGLSPRGLREIASRLPEFTGPVRIIYGRRDRILTDIATTVDRVKRDLPQAEVTAFAECGHFLQEERPHEIGALLSAFFA